MGLLQTIMKSPFAMRLWLVGLGLSASSALVATTPLVVAQPPASRAPSGSGSGSGLCDPSLDNCAVPSHPRLTTICKSPPVYVIADFLSKPECEELIASTTRMQQQDYGDDIVRFRLKRLLPLIPLYGIGVLSLIFGAGYTPEDAALSSFCGIGSACAVVAAASALSVKSGLLQVFTGTKWAAHGTPAAQPFAERLCTLFDTSDSRFEPITVTRYRTGEFQRKHVDARLDGERDAAYIRNGGQRLAQIIVYLCDVEAGGETRFFGDAFSEGWRNDDGANHEGEVDTAMYPKAGMALVFPTATLDGTTDERYVHSGEPVQRGTKWIIGTWLMHHEHDYSE